MVSKVLTSRALYPQAIDVWTGVCLTFVFGALLEFALVNYASRSDKHREKLKEKLKEQKKQWEAEHAAALEAAMQDQTEDGHTFAMVSNLTQHYAGNLKVPEHLSEAPS